MSDFNQLIENLKKDLQSLPPSIEECQLSIKTRPESIAAKTATKTFIRHEWVVYFIRHWFPSAAIFLFFMILLSIVKPDFLYVSKKQRHSRHEMTATRFSIFNLFFYSAFMTGCIQGIFVLQHFLVQKIKCV